LSVGIATKKHKRRKKGGEGTSHDDCQNNIFELCDIVRETAFAIHAFHRHGHLEKVYENALAHRLRKLGLAVAQQQPLIVYDEDGTIIGEYKADLMIEGCIIVEIKACAAVVNEHVAQVLGYLRSSRIEHGLLINFGAPKFSIRKYILSSLRADENPIEE
jgi:GxxExxY protein